MHTHTHLYINPLCCSRERCRHRRQRDRSSHLNFDKGCTSTRSILRTILCSGFQNFPLSNILFLCLFLCRFAPSLTPRFPLSIRGRLKHQPPSTVLNSPCSHDTEEGPQFTSGNNDHATSPPRVTDDEDDEETKGISGLSLYLRESKQYQVPVPPIKKQERYPQVAKPHTLFCRRDGEKQLASVEFPRPQIRTLITRLDTHYLH